MNVFNRSSSVELQRRQQLMQQQQQAQRQMPGMMQQRPAHSQSLQSLASSYENSGRYKIIQDVNPPMGHGLQQQAFKKSYYTIQGISVPCVNMNPYSYTESELLLSVDDFKMLLFPNLSFEMCVERLSVLKIQQYLGNRYVF